VISRPDLLVRSPRVSLTTFGAGLSAGMLAGLPCGGAACTGHAVVGFAIVGGWFVLMAWGGIARLVKREPNEWFWRLLAVLQVLLGVQLVAGVTLLALGHRADAWLHYFYGIVFPVIVLVIAHVFARGLEDESDTWKVFAWAAFFIFGLTLRALTTGLGLP
jgi:hypothetical protein